MAEKNKPTQGDSTSGRLKDDEILELTDEVLSTSDEDIIELSDVADVSSTQDEEEDEMVDLTDVADISSEEPEVEEIMDLTDITDDFPPHDDEVINLDDVFEEFSPQDEEIVEIEDITDESPPQSDEIIELEYVIEESPADIKSDTPVSTFSDEAEALKSSGPDQRSLIEETGLDLEFESPEEPIESKDLDSQLADMVSGSDQDEESLEETVELTELDGEISISEAIRTDAQEDISDALELTDLDSETIDKELRDLTPDFETTTPVDTVELKDLDSGVDTEPEDQVQAEETTTENLEISNQDEALLDEESSFDLESPAQIQTAESAGIKEGQQPKPYADLEYETIKDTTEIEDSPGEALDKVESSVQAEEAPVESLELSDSDREIIDQELRLNFEDESTGELAPTEDELETPEKELSLGLEIEDLNDTVDIKETEGEPPAQIEKPQMETEAPIEQDSNLAEAELAVDFDKDDNLADSLGMTLETEMDQKDLSEKQKPFDPYKTQDMLDEIAQFDEVSPKAMHKMADPISIRVQDPAAEEHLEIDSLEQTVEPTVDSVSPEQIELILERVIKKMFSEKIEKLLVEVIERTVNKEIDRIKGILLDEISGDA